MAECNACGVRVSPDEHFCGNCGTQLIPNSPELKTVAANLGEDGGVQFEPAPKVDSPAAVSEPFAPEPPPAPVSPLVPEVAPEPEPTPISSASLGGSYTDNVQQETSAPARGTGGKQPEGAQATEAETVMLEGGTDDGESRRGGGSNRSLVALLGQVPEAPPRPPESL